MSHGAAVAAAPPASEAPRPSTLEGISWLLLAVAALFTVTRATLTGDAAPAVSMALLLGVGALLFRGTNAHLFRIAFALNVIWVFILAAYFVDLRGMPFTAGGDDILFFETSVDLGKSWARGDWAAHSRYDYYSGYGYIMLGAALYVASAPFGEFGPLVIRIWGAFAGAVIGPAIYVLVRALMREAHPRFWAGTALAAGAFPILTYYASIGLRDIWLAAMATWVITALSVARLERAGALVGWVAPIGLMLVGTLFRPESALALLAFWFGLLYARRHTVSARIASAFILVSAVVLFSMFIETILIQIIRQQLTYAYAADTAGAGSLGARILQIPPPLGYVARFVYALVTPVPPLAAVRVDTILVGLGATAWYFALPLAAGGVGIVARRGPEEKAIANGILAFGAVLLLGVALTSIDVRHKLPLIPVTVLLAACALQGRDRRWIIDRLTVVALAGAALGGVYLVLKLG